MRKVFLLIFVILCASCKKGSWIDDGFLGGIHLSSSKTGLSISNGTVASGGTVTVTLFTRDQNGTSFYVPNGNPVVTFSASGGTSTGTLSEITNHRNGTYTATFTGGAAGTATTLSATVDGVLVDSTVNVQVLSTLTSFSITSATVTSGNAIHLVWGASSGATSYTVKYGTSSGSYPTVFSTNATSPLDVTGLTPGTTYYLMVSAINGSGSVDANAEASATAMGAFTMSSVTPSTGAAVVAWGSATGATSYDILYDTTSHAGGGTYASSSTGVASGASVSGLSAGTTYYFRVRANGASGSVLSTNELSSAVYQNFTLDIPFSFGTDSSYVISDSSRVQLTGGVARLTPSDQTDNDGTASHFGGATMTGVQWDSTNNYVRLNTTTNNAELDPSWTPQWSSLVGYWKMDSDFSATIGANVSASAPGASISSSIFKIGGGSAIFDGTSYAATTPTSTYAFPDTTFSVSFWFKSTGTGSYFIANGGTSNGGWAIGLSSGKPFVILKDCSGGGPAIISNAAMNDGSWHHLAALITTSTTVISLNSANLYIDGIFSKNGSATTTYYCDPASGYKLMLGARGGGSDLYTGNVDDVAIWSTALTSSQIQTIYARQSAKYSGQLTSRVMDGLATGQSWTTLSSTSTLPFYKELPGASGSESSANYSSQSASFMNGIVGLWNLDEPSGTTGAGSIKDSSGGGNNGNPSNVTLGSTGKLGTSASFNGSSSCIQVADSASLDPSASISVSAWINPASFSTWNQILLKWGWGSNVPNQFFMGLNSGTPVFRVWQSNGADIWATASSSINTGGWTHLLGVANSTNGTVQLFVNGVLSGSTTFNGTISVPASPNPLTIGCQYGAGTYYFSGNIDEVAIWNRALSSTEILELYRRGANRLKHQIRSCSAADCSDQDALSTKGWKGPDNTNQTYFSELYNTTNNVLGGTVSTGSPTMTFANFSGSGLSVSTNRYFQYRTILESDDTNSLCNYGSGATACSPELQSVSVGPTHYDTTVQTITSKASIGSAYQTLTGFAETLISNGCSAGARYALSPDGTNYYYWNSVSGSWVASSSTYATASPGTDFSTNITGFPGAAGTGTLQIMTFLKSDGTSACEVDNLQFTGKKY